MSNRSVREESSLLEDCLRELEMTGTAIDKAQADYLLSLVDKMNQKMIRIRDERDDAVRMLEEFERKHDTSPLDTALMIGELGRRTLKAEREIDEINGKILGQLSQVLAEATKLQKRNQFLEHELIALGHINCEWCLYWKQDKDSSDEGVCERSMGDCVTYPLFKISTVEWKGSVLKTLINFGCKEGKAK